MTIPAFLMIYARPSETRYALTVRSHRERSPIGRQELVTCKVSCKLSGSDAACGTLYLSESPKLWKTIGPMVDHTNADRLAYSRLR